jgi:hypothetical protein
MRQSAQTRRNLVGTMHNRPGAMRSAARSSLSEAVAPEPEPVLEGVGLGAVAARKAAYKATP